MHGLQTTMYLPVTHKVSRLKGIISLSIFELSALVHLLQTPPSISNSLIKIQFMHDGHRFQPVGPIYMKRLRALGQFVGLQIHQVKRED
ncbi:unnamed protein product [Ambrosiozyma monospora]|uniref:Unnamed protein product n=1 Tax=Ambrosiozyma monospora TaxID=43982 RepID=A0A9W6Z163_AMBMO|nr:unnamed protein product [Ambrosiozyma monospora]